MAGALLLLRGRRGEGVKFRDGLLVFIAGGVTYDIVQSIANDRWASALYIGLVILMVLLRLIAWHRQRYVRRAALGDGGGGQG